MSFLITHIRISYTVTRLWPGHIFVKGRWCINQENVICPEVYATYRSKMVVPVLSLALFYPTRLQSYDPTFINGLRKDGRTDVRTGGRTNTVFIGRSLSTGRAVCSTGREGKSESENSILCQTYAKTDDHIELKLCFSSRYPRHLFPAQRKMQHLRVSWRNQCIWRLDFCQIIKSCSTVTFTYCID